MKPRRKKRRTWERKYTIKGLTGTGTHLCCQRGHLKAHSATFPTALLIPQRQRQRPRHRRKHLKPCSVSRRRHLQKEVFQGRAPLAENKVKLIFQQPPPREPPSQGVTCVYHAGPGGLQAPSHPPHPAADGKLQSKHK